MNTTGSPFLSDNFQAIVGILFWGFVTAVFFCTQAERCFSSKTCTAPVVAKIVSLGFTSKDYCSDLRPKRSRYCRVVYEFKGEVFREWVLVTTYRRRFCEGDLVRIHVDPQDPSRCITKPEDVEDI